MLDTLDQFMKLSPQAEAKWGRLIELDKCWISFEFWVSLFSSGGLVKLPDLVSGGRIVKRGIIGVDVECGWLIITIHRDECLLLDIDVEELYSESESPSPPA